MKNIVNGEVIGILMYTDPQATLCRCQPKLKRSPPLFEAHDVGEHTQQIVFSLFYISFYFQITYQFEFAPNDFFFLTCVNRAHTPTMAVEVDSFSVKVRMNEISVRIDAIGEFNSE